MYKAKVKELLALPKVEQKSEQWYELRQNMITASDFAQALGEGKFGTQKQLIEKKCTPRGNEAAISASNPFFKWGHMFEPVACDIYSKMHNVFVHEFGLIQHPKHSFFGASPDGITDDGVMLEIKCPMKRKLTGDVPMQYYYQIQGQLDVCGLRDCDYFECTFQIVPSYEEWCEKSEYIRGVFKSTSSEDTPYLYQKPFLVGEAIDDVWRDFGCQYWILKEYNLKRVTKDAAFVKEKLKELKKVWEQIEYYRKNPVALEIEVKSAITIETETAPNWTVKAQASAKAMKELKTTDKCMFLDD
jgi:putative phage-type endonuclease